MCKCICKCIICIPFIYAILWIIFLLLDYNPEYKCPEGVCIGNITHKGKCGNCSNVHDLQAYEDTKDTLSTKARECAIWDATTSCLDELTTPCAQCWVDNMKCTRNHCWFVCAWALHFPNIHTKCIDCDELHCGNNFTKCAGLNRRRANITTDIPRKECKN